MTNQSLPSSFSSNPGEENHHYFRNICLQFKKVIKKSKDIDELEMEMETLINAARDMEWKETNNGVAKKTESEKLLTKLFREFKRYIEVLEKNSEAAVYEDLLLALEEFIDIFTAR